MKRYGYPTPPLRKRGRTGGRSIPGMFARSMGSAALRYAASGGNPASAAMAGVGSLARGFMARKRAAKSIARNNNLRAGKARAYSKSSSTATGASYQGKFKVKKYTKKSDPYRKFGFVHTSEVNGTVSDPNCIYLGHSAMSGTSMLALMCQALMRKLFKKGSGWDCPSIDTPIKGYEGFADGWRVILVMRQYDTGVETTYSADTSTTETIYTLVGDPASGVTGTFANFFNFIYAYATSSSLATTAVNVPVRLELYGKDGNVTNFWRHCAGINLLNEVVHIRCKSEMKIQNRSLAATGNELTESVSNNPLVGRVYHFDTGAPRSNTEGVQFVETINDYNGVVTTRAAQFTALTVMREPPQASLFTNVTHSAKIRLEPGAIKNDSIVYTKSMNWLKFLDYWGFRVSNTAGSYKQIKIKGKSALFALEDLINVNSTQNIICAYEVNRDFSCYFTSAGTTYSFGKLFQVTQDNLAP